jgi:hypothetical protein
MPPNVVLKSRNLFVNYFYECYVLENYQVLVCTINRRSRLVIDRTTISDDYFLVFREHILSRGFYISDFNDEVATDSETP